MTVDKNGSSEGIPGTGGFRGFLFLAAADENTFRGALREVLPSGPRARDRGRRVLTIKHYSNRQHKRTKSNRRH